MNANFRIELSYWIAGRYLEIRADAESSARH